MKIIFFSTFELPRSIWMEIFELQIQTYSNDARPISPPKHQDLWQIHREKETLSWDLGEIIILGFVRIRVWGIYEFDGYVASEFIVDTITTVNSESLQRTNAQQVRAKQKEELLKQGVNSLVGGGWLWHHLRRADQEDWKSPWGEFGQGHDILSRLNLY